MNRIKAIMVFAFSNLMAKLNFSQDKLLSINNMKDRNYSPAYGPAKGFTPPICKKCGNFLRKEKYQTKNNFGALASNPPWNSGWNGKCAHCGFDFNIDFIKNLSVFQSKGDHVENGRKTKISVASRGYPIYYDVGESLSGILIEITSFGRYFPEQTERIFISTNELKHIIPILNDSPILEQFDWGGKIGPNIPTTLSNGDIVISQIMGTRTKSVLMNEFKKI